MKTQPISYPSSLPRDLPGFDIEETVERMMGRTDMWWRVLEIFHSKFGGWHSSWHESQAVRESERKSVHALRSAAANVGAFRLAESAAALENALLEPGGSQSSLTLLRLQLQESFDEAQRSAAQALGRLSLPEHKSP